LLNCPNGIVDVRTGELIEHSKESLCSKMTRVDYHPEAMCPRFQVFLDEIMCGDTETVQFLQRWFGYSLTTDVSAQAFTVFFGTGANGKSTLVELIGKILDGYCKPAPPDTFISNPNGGSKIPNDIAALRGMRLVLSTETEANARLAESKIKSMTGGDMISARFMRGEFFEIKPTWKIIMSTNHRPRISGADNGIWRRIITVPFNFVATPDKMNCNLPKELWEEREGVLAWMVRGAMDWYKDGGGRPGLHVSKSIDEETQDYREDEDVVGRFLSQGCLGEAEADELGIELSKCRISATELHACFVRWANINGEVNASKISPTAFGRALMERGMRKTRTKSNNFYFGISPRGDLGKEEQQ
jgi:putative DNA primase/helicase